MRRCGAGAGAPRPGSANGPPGAPWGPFIQLRPTGARAPPRPAPPAPPSSPPAAEEARRPRPRADLDAAGAPPCPPPRGPGDPLPRTRPGAHLQPAGPGSPGVARLRGSGQLFSVEGTGALQQEGLWEDRRSREKTAARRQLAAFARVPLWPRECLSEAQLPLLQSQVVWPPSELSWGLHSVGP